MPPAEKTCIFCKRDCSDRERVIDERGRYACKVCLDAAKQIRDMSRRDAPDTPNAFETDPSIEPTPGETAGGTAGGTQVADGTHGDSADTDPPQKPATPDPSDAPTSGSPGGTGVDAAAQASAIDELRAEIEKLRAAIEPGRGPAAHPNRSPSSSTSPPPLQDDNDGLPFTLTPDDGPTHGSARDPRKDSARGVHPEPDPFALPTHDDCPNCGGAIPPFARLCVHCGTDLSTGERVRGADEDDANTDTKTDNPDAGSQAGRSTDETEPESKADADSDADASKSARRSSDGSPDPDAIPKRPRRSLAISPGHLLAVPLALLVAGLWVLFRVNATSTMPAFAALVGVATGTGMYLGNRRRPLASPRFALLVTLLGIALGTVGAAAVGAHQLRAEAARYDADHKGLAAVADEVVAEWQADPQRVLDWPSWGNADKVRGELRYWPYGYPASVETEARDRWASLSDAERTARAQAVDAARAEHRVFLADRALIEVFWIAVGLIAAHAIGVVGLDTLYNRFIEKMS